MAPFLPTVPTRMSSSDAASDSAQDNPLSRQGLPSPLLLGSASFTRKLILGEMRIPYHTVVRPIDERGLGDRTRDDPRDLVLTLAAAKMDRLVDEIRRGRCADELPPAVTTPGAAAADAREWVVLTGDQVVVHRGRILEKPASAAEARDFAVGYATAPCRTVGACVLAHLPSGTRVCGTDTAAVHFRPTIGGAVVDRLLEEGAPVLSCAGGLMIEHPLVREHVDRIEGTEDSVMGLSKALVERLLGELKEKLEES